MKISYGNNSYIVLYVDDKVKRKGKKNRWMNRKSRCGGVFILRFGGVGGSGRVGATQTP